MLPPPQTTGRPKITGPLPELGDDDLPTNAAVLDDATVTFDALPDRPVEDFVADFKALVEPSGVEVEVIMAFSPAITDTGSRLYSAIQDITAERHPGSRVMPAVSPGFTDSHYFRERGVVAYGWSPIVLRPGDGPPHGVDESISVEAVRATALLAGMRRVRPCLMTTATTALALLPVVTSQGRGADVMVPMALPSLGGMAAILMTLFVVPVLYAWVEERRLGS